MQNWNTSGHFTTKQSPRVYYRGIHLAGKLMIRDPIIQKAHLIFDNHLIPRLPCIHSENLLLFVH